MTELNTEEKTVLQSIGGLKIVDVSEQDAHLKGLIYGYPGAGKTHLLGTLVEVPELMPCLWIDIEKGSRTIRDRKGIQVVRPATTLNKDGSYNTVAWKQLFDIYTELQKGAAAHFRTIVLDNLSESERMAMEHTMWRLSTKKPERVDPNNPDSGPSVREWGQSNDKVTLMVRAFRDLPCNILMTAHVTEVKNDSGNIEKILPGLPGQLGYKVAGFMDLVAYLYVKTINGEDVRGLLTSQTQKESAKARDTLPKVIQRPTMKQIIELADQAHQAKLGA